MSEALAHQSASDMPRGQSLGRVRRGWRFGARIMERLALRTLDRIEHGALELRLPDGEVRRFGSGPPVAVTVESRDVFRRLARSPRLGLGESYAAGDWHADDLPAFLELVFRNVEAWRRRSRLARLERVRPHLPPRQSLRRARDNIRYHYDLGNHGLEIGCGWGSFALTAAGDYGARVTGLTISEQQVALARQRIAEAGLGDRVEILFQDYRTLEGQFTKLASIEMIEAIGYAQFPTFFAACDRLLAPGGRALIQTITVPDERFESYRRHEDWIRRYIFPGSLLPSVDALRKAMGRFEIATQEEIGPHYATTLKTWRERFLAQLSEVRGLAFDERFVRIWEFYLASCEALFRTRAIGGVQLVLERA